MPESSMTAPNKTAPTFGDIVRRDFPSRFTAMMLFHDGGAQVELVGAKCESLAGVFPENVEFLARFTVDGEEVLNIGPDDVSPENLGKICDLIRALSGPILPNP